MKTEFVSGKWYKNLGSSGSYIAKFEKMDGDSFCGTAYIYDKKYEKTIDLGNRITSFHKNAIECPLEEIQQYLPDGHPDKIVKEGNWCVRLTQENKDIIIEWMNNSSYVYNIGSYYGINNGVKNTNSTKPFGRMLTTEEFLQKIGKNIDTSEYKVGDWIYTLPNSYGFGMLKADEGKLFKVIERDSVDNKLYLDPLSNINTKTTGAITVREKAVRKATTKEIMEHLFCPQHTKEINIVDYPYATTDYDLSKSLQEQIRQHGVMQHTIFEESLLKDLEHYLKTTQDSNSISLLRKNKSKILNTNIIPVQSISISLKTKLNKK